MIVYRLSYQTGWQQHLPSASCEQFGIVGVQVVGSYRVPYLDIFFLAPETCTDSFIVPPLARRLGCGAPGHVGQCKHTNAL
jgi:hypothetical protein